MKRPTKVLVIQLPYDEARSPVANLDFRHELENTLDAALQRNRSGFVDGGDIGPDGINVWVHVTTWNAGIPIVEAYLKHLGLLDRAVVAKRISDEKWQVIWPKNYGKPFSLLGPGC